MPSEIAEEKKPVLPPANSSVCKIVKMIILGLFRLCYRVGVEGLENVPVDKPVIFVANHQSYLDIPAIGFSLAKINVLNRLYWITGKNTFRNPGLNWFLRFCPLIVVNGTVRSALAVLDRGYCVNIFPEGYYVFQRYRYKREGKDPDTLERKLGNSAAILALKTGLHVVPIGIRGTEEALPPFARFPRPVKIFVKIGKPFRFDPPEPEAVTPEMLQEKSEFIMKHVDALR
ncbi:MAG: hypothetical protein A3G33_10955 [Omnitrophica bacterium RIFCSPLOWO2_12_FULL_44_17]|uniref:Phospholipid/glycerol acyltransferase domain-containing protein n=1 Tax=Candidatus Danuiimicrobium aquiferis TaxID=1801832 RepID=A0A1G1KSZ3_9BACT|nr:MAG: hypothetical protein A3B72_01135 [Omnitrophica bacterium RIFCSPHIGHO2_02_FULL_45_28]OGW96017.1 MAG: hypothetical protein A3G33_10955 [Omnitrophica bacterium RIFCSPLOWO2_12_FULL_44_17]OGX03070.1 MAG: hypothetical protein A3J12_08580 [Omnitrophica bacterium RIFCSPLOWO2_02_FULL_44_11]